MTFCPLHSLCIIRYLPDRLLSCVTRSSFMSHRGPGKLDKTLLGKPIVAEKPAPGRLNHSSGSRFVSRKGLLPVAKGGSGQVQSICSGAHATLAGPSVTCYRVFRSCSCWLRQRSQFAGPTAGAARMRGQQQAPLGGSSHSRHRPWTSICAAYSGAVFARSVRSRCRLWATLMRAIRSPAHCQAIEPTNDTR